jgi:hypothetical protein
VGSIPTVSNFFLNFDVQRQGFDGRGFNDHCFPLIRNVQIEIRGNEITGLSRFVHSGLLLHVAGVS